MLAKNKTLTIRAMKPEDFPTLRGFWREHGWDAPPELAMPVPYFLAVDDSGEIVAGEGLLVSKYNGLGMQEWLVTNPEADPKLTLKAMRLLDAMIEERARFENCWALMSFCKQEGLAKIKQRLGFERTDEGMIHLVKALYPQD